MAQLITGLGGTHGFGENILSRTDDGSTQAVDITSVFENGLNFFGTVYNEVFVNNNGSITFENPRGAFTPSVITETSNNPEITPFFADVDTHMGDFGGEEPADLPNGEAGNSTGSNLVFYDLDLQHDRLVVTWDDVGYFSSNTDKLNSFQLVIEDEGSGDFDIQFRYEDINWTTGDYSGGSDGLGGSVARAGWTAGTGNPEEYYELPASGDEQAMLSLEDSIGNGSSEGIWDWRVRNGEVVEIDEDDVIDPPDGPRGKSTGDPHLVTFDGLAYDFMGVGEFVLARDTAGSMEIQARHEPWGNSDSVSVITAVATSLGGTTVMVDTSDENVLQIDGQDATIGDGQYIDVGDGRIYRNGNVYTIIYPGDDDTVNDGDEQLVVTDRGQFLDLEIRLDDASGNFEGLLGDADSDPGNDIARANGDVINQPLSFDDLYGDYRSDWVILDQNDSLFSYDAGETPSGFYLPDFPDGIITVDDLDTETRTTAEEQVSNAGIEPGTANFENAVLDYALTEDETFIESADESFQTPEDNVAEVVDDPTEPLAEDDNFVVLQYASPDIIGSGSGNDIYLLSPYLLPEGSSKTITDTQGNNSIQLNEGLSIDNSKVAANALMLTLDNGSEITILGADKFGYEPGGNLTIGIDNADMDFSTFVENILGTTVPTSGVNNGGAVVIEPDQEETSLPVGSTDTFTGTDEAEVFALDVENALSSSEVTQIELTSFDVSEDLLRFDLPDATGETTLAELNGSQSVSVQHDIFNNLTLINFGANDIGDVVVLTLSGVTDSSLINVDVV